MLQYAKSLPNAHVLVLVDSDRRVRELKGESRPINTSYERAQLLDALKSVDDVDVFDSDEELIEKIKNYNPDVMVKGSDYEGKPIIGAEYCKEIKFFKLLNEYSTTKKIQYITYITRLFLLSYL